VKPTTSTSAAINLLVAIGSLLAVTTPPVAAGTPTIEITFAESVSDKPYTGRVYIMTTTRGRNPKSGPDWFNPQPFFAQDAVDWRPGESLAMNPDKTMGYPFALADLPPGKRWVQAVMDLSDWSRSVTNGPGNGYSKAIEVDFGSDEPATIALHIDRTIPEPRASDSESIKYVKLKSRLLSEFHGRDVYLRAAVGLPEGYDEDPHRRYPTLYEIPGFGGRLSDAGFELRHDQYADHGLEIVRVYLDPECPTGHHVFADSANNGPVGTALTEELIPHLEKTFRLIPETGARYATGLSSGGWSSLWLQVAYPDVFGGVWSLAPDPIDFTAFQWPDLYAADANMYFRPEGTLIPASRDQGMRVIFTKGMCDMEVVLGRGGQFQSFEAVFSPRGADGKPLRLWDRETGKVDPRVAQAWRNYDIRQILESNWQQLEPKLAGKLTIICGDADTFYLERAVMRVKDVLAKLGSDASVVIVPDAGHGLTPLVHQQVAEQIAERFKRFQTRGG
jgi:pimeloyl-ACP methyl ester carboxylesterase